MKEIKKFIKKLAEYGIRLAYLHSLSSFMNNIDLRRITDAKQKNKPKSIDMSLRKDISDAFGLKDFVHYKPMTNRAAFKLVKMYSNVLDTKLCDIGLDQLFEHNDLFYNGDGRYSAANYVCCTFLRDIIECEFKLKQL